MGSINVVRVLKSLLFFFLSFKDKHFKILKEAEDLRTELSNKTVAVKVGLFLNSNFPGKF